MMQAHLVGSNRWIDATPICGEDFCDDCGDCLWCYTGDYCPGGWHIWVVYGDEEDEWRAAHGIPTVEEELVARTVKLKKLMEVADD